MGTAPKPQPAHNTDPFTRARVVAILDQDVEGLFLGIISLARPRLRRTT
jgi:hypothetical protein